GANLGQEGKKISKWAAEPIDRPGHDDIDFPARSGLMQRVESGPLIPPFAAADPVILINLVDLPAGTLGDSPQLALLIGRGLVDCGDPEVESGAFHGKSPHLSADTVSDLVRKIYSFCTHAIGIHKPLFLLIVICGILRGFFHTSLFVVFDR